MSQNSLLEYNGGTPQSAVSVVGAVTSRRGYAETALRTRLLAKQAILLGMEAEMLQC